MRQETVLLRMHSQRLMDGKRTHPQDLVHYMGAMQAQDIGMCKWAVGVRLPGWTVGEIQNALDSGEILRTHVLRPTWHLVARADIRWMIALTAPRILSSMKRRHNEIGLSEKIFQKSAAVIIDALQGGNHLTREELNARLNESGISTGDNRLSHLLMRAEVEGIICSGSLKGAKMTYALLPERVPVSNHLSKDEALALLAGRYFQSRSPATLQDFTWWSGLSASDARKAVQLAPPKIRELGTVFNPANQPKDNRCVLLPAFDEYVISYKDRSEILPGELNGRAISANGIFRPVIIMDGVVAGIWKRTEKKDRILVDAVLFHEIGSDGRHEIEQAAARYGFFLGKDIEINFKNER